MDSAHERIRKRRNVIVVLPAFNEEACIGRLLDKIDEAMFEAGLSFQVIVVDDGSTDRTAELVQERAAQMPVTVVRHEKNAGLGAAIRDGLQAAMNAAQDDDIIITMDADDTHTPGLILRMVRMVSEGHDVVIASRYQPGSRTLGVPMFRRVLSYAGSLLFRIFLPIQGVKDFTCGYRAYRTAVLRDAMREYNDRFIDQEGFQCMVDILLKLRKRHLLFGEVPMILRYDQKAGVSKMQVGNTIFRTLALIVKRRFQG
ncbi:MAG TPA: glycosyltransferase family 2 protein [Candidatus Hydrogenedentes bacterium]|nr:glycosyltransferase family 2 protein [Candidatus Hydrogenedentota bacterium]